MKKCIGKIVLLLWVFAFFQVHQAAAQVEVEPWGNLSGIRIDGQLMEIPTDISLVKENWQYIESTGKEKQRPRYIRKGNQQIVTTTLDSLYITETAADVAKGSATLQVELNPHSRASITGVFLHLQVPRSLYGNGTVQSGRQKAIPFSATATAMQQYLQNPATSIRFASPLRQLTITFSEPAVISIQPGSDNKYLHLYIPIQTGNVQAGQAVTKTFTLTTAGPVDKKPVTFSLNTAQAGRTFDGFGGNFRLQNPRTDPQVIDYCLANMKVSWGRVEMPWRFWQPAMDSSPIAAAQGGRLNLQVKGAMDMAQRLYKMGMPVILTAWSAPAWAIVGPPRFQPSPEGIWGNPLDHTKTTQIYQSIADYIQYLKDAYGVEISLFSFNESDLGINIRQTGEEHAELIKGLGAYLASRGLKTKLLLGDNSDATTYHFIDAAMNDAATHPYIGAVSFHSWRGWNNETLQHWANAATKLHLPLLVGEGSIDAQAWGYPQIFLEPNYALQEINLYTRLLAICQPASILQWQLTADYSPLAGGGIFGDNGPLRPTQRFWNLKQLASTPAGLQVMPLTSTAANISAAALGNNDRQQYAFHLVNNGAARQVTLTGLPKKVKALKLFVTNARQPMQQGKPVAVVNGAATFTLNATSYATLMNK